MSWRECDRPKSLWIIEEYSPSLSFNRSRRYGRKVNVWLPACNGGNEICYTRREARKRREILKKYIPYGRFRVSQYERSWFSV